MFRKPVHFSELSFWISLLIGSAQTLNCSVSSFSTVKDFSSSKFEGLWYAYSTLTVTSLEDITHNYVTDGEGSLTVYLRERIPDRECSHAQYKLGLPDGSNGVSSKLEQVLSNGARKPFWVMETDYTSFAVVYGCSEVQESTGLCTASGVSSWIWTRRKKPNLSKETLSKITDIMANLCTDPNKYRTIRHNQQGCRQCKPNMWTVQGDFKINKFIGFWYLSMSIPMKNNSDVIAYEHEYSDSKEAILVKRKGGSGTDDSEVCADLSDGSMTLTNIPGIMRISVDEIDYEYRVVEVDYSKMAFIIGCADIDALGNCDKYVSWVLSRDRYLSGRNALWIFGLMDQYCIEQDLYIGTNPSKCSGTDLTHSPVKKLIWTLLAAFVFNSIIWGTYL